MGNSNTCKKSTIASESSVPTFTSEEINQLLSQTQAIGRNARNRIRISFLQTKPLSSHFLNASTASHWEIVVLIHQKYKSSIENNIDEALKISETVLVEGIADQPSKQSSKRDKIRTNLYLKHCMNDDNILSNDIEEMLLLAAWRLSDDMWVEDLLEDEIDMSSPAVFSLLKEALRRFNRFLDPNATAIEHVLTFHLLYRYFLYRRLLYLHLLYRHWIIPTSTRPSLDLRSPSAGLYLCFYRSTFNMSSSGISNSILHYWGVTFVSFNGLFNFTW